MAVKLIHKNSGVKNKPVVPSQLEYGEISINWHDSGPFIQVKDASNEIVRVGGVIIQANQPALAQKGAFWLSGTELYLYNGGAWILISGGGGGTGSDFIACTDGGLVFDTTDNCWQIDEAWLLEWAQNNSPGSTPPGNGELTILDSDGDPLGTFTANQTGDVEITIPTSGFSGDYNDLTNKPDIGKGTLTLKGTDGTQFGAFNANQSGDLDIEIPSSSFSGNYNDLSNKPTIGDGELKIENAGGTALGTFKANQTGPTVITLPASSGFSGDYDDLVNKPTIGDGKLTIKNSDNSIAGEFTANQVGTTDVTLPAVGDGTLTIKNADDSTAGTFKANQDTSTEIKLPAEFSGDYNDLTNTPCVPACPTCVEPESLIPGAYDNFAHPIDPGPDMGFIYSIGYHPDFGWRGICNKKKDTTNKAFYGIKPGASLDVWEQIGAFPVGEHQKFMGQMVPIGDKLVAILWGSSYKVYRLEFSESSITSEEIFESNMVPVFTYTDYDSERETWFIHGAAWPFDPDGNESWEYNENTKVATEGDGLVLARTSVDGKIISVTTTGLEFEDGSTKELWNPLDVEGDLPNNASIAYSPELNQIAVVVSLSAGQSTVFNHARNLWVSDDKGVTWREIDTEPDPDWTGEIVQWSGIDWLPNATNRKGTKGLWIAQSMRGGGMLLEEGHLHTLTSDDGVTWKFDYGYEWKHYFDGKYTVTDGSNYIVTGLGDGYGGTIDDVNPLQRMAYRSETATVQLPGAAVVESTEGLEPGMFIQSGDKRAEVLEVIDGTTFTYEGEVTAGEEYCSTTPIHWDDIVGKPDPDILISWDDIVGKPCIPECELPTCTVEVEYLGNVNPSDYGDLIEERQLPNRGDRSIAWHTYRLKDYDQRVLFEQLNGEIKWGALLQFEDLFDAAGVIREADGTEFFWFQTSQTGPAGSYDSVVRTDTDLCTISEEEEEYMPLDLRKLPELTVDPA